MWPFPVYKGVCSHLSWYIQVQGKSAPAWKRNRKFSAQCDLSTTMCRGPWPPDLGHFLHCQSLTAEQGHFPQRRRHGITLSCTLGAVAPALPALWLWSSRRLDQGQNSLSTQDANHAFNRQSLHLTGTFSKNSVSLVPYNSVNFCFLFFMHLSYTLYWSFYFSVCMLTSLGFSEPLTVFSCFYLLFLCVLDLCMLVFVYPYPSMYLSLCISCALVVCISLSLCAHGSLHISVWASNEPFCLSVGAFPFLFIIEFLCSWIFTCFWIFAFSWVFIVSLCLCSSLNLHVPESLHVI